MTTIVEAMTDATAELHAAALLYQSRADQVAANLAATTTNAQTIINTFIGRGASKDYFVDINVGVDAAGYGTLAQPFRTLDYALETRDPSLFTSIFLLTDNNFTRNVQAHTSTFIIGVSRAIGPFNSPYSYASRRITIGSEAVNSPRPGLGRLVPLLDVYGGTLKFLSVDLALPTPPPGIDFPNVIAVSGGDVSFESTSVTVESAESRACLLFASGGQRTTVSFANVSFGPNMPGKIFAGVAAGANPNAFYYYETNLTSA